MKHIDLQYWQELGYIEPHENARLTWDNWIDTPRRRLDHITAEDLETDAANEGPEPRPTD